MPWPKEHKVETRERIVDAAAAAFRESGVADVGVAEIMRRAGLTHGGFYAHFPSKDDLVAEVVPHAMSQAHGSLATLQDAGPDGLLATAMAYLSAAHLNHPERGCPVAALGPELSRGSRRVRTTLSAEIHKRLEQLDKLQPQERAQEDRRRDSIGALACMVGGLILARGLKPSEQTAFLSSCREFLSGALAAEPR